MSSRSERCISPLLALPLELRQAIYAVLFLSPVDLAADLAVPSSSWSAPSALPLLRVSKSVCADAGEVLYAFNQFVIAVPNPTLNCGWGQRPPMDEVPWVFGATRGRLDDSVRARLSTDVAALYGREVNALPQWLLGDAFVGDAAADEYIGVAFARFLREVGQENAAKVTKLKVKFMGLPDACHLMPLFAELLRRHVPGLRMLQIYIRCMEVHDLDEDGSVPWNDNQESFLEGLRGELRVLLLDLADIRRFCITTDCPFYEPMLEGMTKTLSQERLHNDLAPGRFCRMS